MPKRPGEYLHVRDGDLAHLDRNGQTHPNEYPEHERLRFYLGLLHLANERGNRPGVAAHRYRDRFGHWPQRTWSFFAAVQPTPEVIAWDRHCRIKFAKSRQKAGAGA